MQSNASGPAWLRLLLGLYRMNIWWPSREQLPRWADWLGVAVMSFAAPMLAAFIHSISALHRGIRLYNAQVGGTYFQGGPGTFGGLGPWEIVGFLWGCAVLAVPTFLVVLWLRPHPFSRRIVWIGCAAFWTWFLFKCEYAVR